MGYPQNIKVTVDAIVFRKTGENPISVLLIQRKNPPFQGKWALPGGFVEDDESLDMAAARELEEETGLKNVEIQQLYTFGEPNRDPRGRAISVTYYTLIETSPPTLQAADDAADVQWFDIESLPALAFDHQGILEMAINQVFTKA
jgi:8-oxo-dGTP diphosphatase